MTEGDLSTKLWTYQDRITNRVFSLNLQKYKWTGHCVCSHYLIMFLTVYNLTVSNLKPFFLFRQKGANAVKSIYRCVTFIYAT